jgi:hypothetical protein
MNHRRPFARISLCAAVAAVSLVASFASNTQADDIGYVDCTWSPYKEAWACGLPAKFTEGRFNAPPYYGQDEASIQARQRTFAQAKTEPGARAQGRLGVFVPSTEGVWSFVPGSSWSPGDPVFMPHAKADPKPAPKADPH